MFCFRRFVVASVVAICSLSNTRSAEAQAGLREALERLDLNENGYIEADEVTPLSRPFLERLVFTRSGKDDEPFRKPISIERLQESARIYFAFRNGARGKDVEPDDDRTVRTFGMDEDEPLLPGFGLSAVRFPYTQADLDFADRTLSSHDDNGDGYIDRDEAVDKKWTHRDPFADDLNRDDRLSKMELAQRYARRRMIDEDGRELVQRGLRTGGDIRKFEKDEKRDDSRAWWSRGGSDYWLTASMMGRFDVNRNGRLEANESASLNMPTSQIDIDRDGEITRDELHAHMTALQNEAGDLSEGLPGWFYELDEDKDGQVSMAEFLVEWSFEKQEEFLSYDSNEDGLLTATELVQAKAVVGGTYRSERAEVLPPHRTIISEIEVEDEFLIRDLDVELSITHTYVSHLDAYLTGPDGQRVELFTEIGGSGDNFEGTVFDDQARTPINKAKSPFRDSFLPEGLVRREPGLSSYNGKSVKGVWQLIIRGTRSERFGMLHGWGLTITPMELAPGKASATSDETAEPSEANVADMP